MFKFVAVCLFTIDEQLTRKTVFNYSFAVAALRLGLAVKASIIVWRDFEGLFMACYFLLQTVLLYNVV